MWPEAFLGNVMHSSVLVNSENDVWYIWPRPANALSDDL